VSEPKTETQALAVPFQPVADVLESRLPSLDSQVVEAVLATVVANAFEGPAVWLELVGAPSMGKTFALEPLVGIEGAEILSKLTPHTLISGSYGPQGSDPSMLTRLGKRPFLIVKELSTLLAGNPFGQGEIYAQLREVYDGNIESSYGNGIKRSWSGKACMIMGITPAIDRHRAFASQLGERCLKLRFGFADGVDAAALAANAFLTAGSEVAVQRELHIAYETALKACEETKNSVQLSKDTIFRISQLAAFAARARTPTERDMYAKGKPLVLPAAPEGPFRIMKNLGFFAMGQAALRGVSDLEDISLVARIAVDCMPEPRRFILLRVLDREAIELDCSDSRS